jgi:hypothetical protein
MFLFAGAIALWAWFSLPVNMPSASSCPAVGEGWHWCVAQRAWGPVLVKLAGALLGAYLISNRLFFRVPPPPRPVAPPSVVQQQRMTADPVLAAASWQQPDAAALHASEDPVLIAFSARIARVAAQRQAPAGVR